MRNNWGKFYCMTLALAACGGNGTASSEGMTEATAPTSITVTGASTGDGESTDTPTGDEPVATTIETTGAPGCPEDCVDQGGVCFGDVCCSGDLACGEVCCPDGQVCSFNKCEQPGAECIDAGECDDDEYCEYSLGEPGTMGMCGGSSLATGKCLPAPPECLEGEEPADPLTCLPKCEVVPETSFEPVLKYQWDKFQVMMTPIVIQLDDDTCDGVVDERDIPEIVFNSFIDGKYNENGTTWAISIVDGAIVEKWSVNFPADANKPVEQLAGGDFDGKPGNEIVHCTISGRARALDAAGNELWITEAAVGCSAPTISDIDADGKPEILTAGAVIDGATGAVKVSLASFRESIPADIDADGDLDIVHARGAFDNAGAVLAETGLNGTYPALADFDLDGKPEIVVISNGGADLPHHLLVWRHDPRQPNNALILRQPIDINGPLSPGLCGPGSLGNTIGGGPPTIGDFNGDGTPDVAVAGGVGYAVFDGEKLLDPNVAGIDTLLWISQTKDCSSARTGSSLFDFEGDGTAEVIYGDESYLRIYKGDDGTVLWQTCATNGTSAEYPAVADVDGDGHADIISIANDYHDPFVCEGSQQRGVRIFGDSKGSWVRTRRVWNQHPYYVTHVREDGTVPSPEAVNWTIPGLNNFRQNTQPEGEFSAPDLIVSLRQQCIPEDYGLIGRVRNIGSASVPAGVQVFFYEGDPDMGGVLLGAGATTKLLYPAEAEDVVLKLPDAPPGVLDGTSVVHVVVDDDMANHVWKECRTDNNRATGDGECYVAG